MVGKEKRQVNMKGRFSLGNLLLLSSIVLMFSVVIIGLLPFESELYDAFLGKALGAFFIGLLMLMVLGMLLRFEEGEVSAQEVAIIGTLGAIAAVVRIPFVAIPSLLPSTFIIITAGVVFGKRVGFMVGAITALASTLFLPFGLFVPFQVIGWGLAGYTSGLIGTIRPNLTIWGLGLLCFAWGFLYGFIVDIWTLTLYLSQGQPLLQSAYVVYGAAFPYNLMHASGNLFFALLLGEQLLWILRRAKARFEVRYKDVLKDKQDVPDPDPSIVTSV